VVRNGEQLSDKCVTRFLRLEENLSVLGGMVATFYSDELGKSRPES
jgi:hypothetical protein